MIIVTNNGMPVDCQIKRKDIYKQTAIITHSVTNRSKEIKYTNGYRPTDRKIMMGVGMQCDQ